MPPKPCDQDWYHSGAFRTVAGVRAADSLWGLRRSAATVSKWPDMKQYRQSERLFEGCGICSFLRAADESAPGTGKRYAVREDLTGGSPSTSGCPVIRAQIASHAARVGKHCATREE
jgi:hypothetical protein